MPMAGALRRPTWTVAGLRRISPASRAITGGMVAEKSSVCSPARQAGDDSFEVGKEAHVEHAVGFVEHERVQTVEAGLVLSHVVQEPAGRGDEHLDAGAQGLFLRPHGRAADKDADPQGRVVGQAQANVVDLLGQLAGRRQDQGPCHARGKSQQLVQDRQKEGGRFASAGLGGGDQVAAGEDGAGLSALGWGSARCSAGRGWPGRAKGEGPGP